MKTCDVSGVEIPPDVEARIKWVEGEKAELARMVNILNNKIDTLNQQIEMHARDNNTMANANRDLQTQLNAVKECFETVITKLAGRNSGYY